MNIEHFNKLKAALRAEVLIDKNRRKIRFNMNTFYDSRVGCGTSACLAGWCHIMDKGEKRLDDISHEKIAEYLEIPNNDAYDMAYGIGSRVRFLSDLSIKDAINMLEIYEREGTVRWSKAMDMTRTKILVT